MKILKALLWLPVWGALGVLTGATGAAEPPPASLDVDEAVRIALRQNYAYQQAGAVVGMAEGSRLDAAAGLLPSAGGSYSYSKSSSATTLKNLDVETRIENGLPIVVRRGSLQLDTDRSGSGLGVSLREDLSFSNWYRYRSAQADVEGARHGQAAAGQDLAYQVRQQFYLLLRAQDLLQVQTEDFRLAQDQERRITSMFELGSVARVDVLKAKVRVSEAELALIRQQNLVDIEKARLATLLGFSADTPLELTGELRTAAAPLDSAEVVIQSASRADLERARERVRSASNLYRSALLSRVPGLFATFDWSTSAGSEQSDNLNQQLLTDVPNPGDSTLALYAFPTDSDAESDGWDLRVGASVNLDAFLNMGQHKRSRSFMHQAEYELEGLQLDVQREIEEAILNYRASQKAIESAESGVASAEEDLRLSQERYQQGLGTVLELLEAQVAITRARNNRVNALTGLKISEAALDKARGAPLPD
jgi:outer membrane protein TolC